MSNTQKKKTDVKPAKTTQKKKSSVKPAKTTQKKKSSVKPAETAEKKKTTPRRKMSVRKPTYTEVALYNQGKLLDEEARSAVANFLSKK